MQNFAAPLKIFFWTKCAGVDVVNTKPKSFSPCSFALK